MRGHLVFGQNFLTIIPTDTLSRQFTVEHDTPADQVRRQRLNVGVQRRSRRTSTQGAKVLMVFHCARNRVDGLLAQVHAAASDDGGDHRRSTRPVHHPRPDGGDTRRQQVRIYRSLDRRKDTALAKALPHPECFFGKWAIMGLGSAENTGIYRVRGRPLRRGTISVPISRLSNFRTPPVSPPNPPRITRSNGNDRLA